MPSDTGFVVWCDRCEWNVDPGGAKDVSARRRDRVSRAMADRLSERLFQEVVRDADLRPHWDVVRLLAYAVAALIHLTTLAVAAGGVALIVGNRFRPVPAGLGMVLLLVAWVLRPRLGRVPTGRPRLGRDDAPALYTMVDRMADLLGAHPVDVILVDASFNASMGTVGLRRRRVLTIGLRRRRVLTIGLRLWNILTPAERVAVLGHELAHDVNGDSTRGLIVGSALAALAEWQRLLTPSRSPRSLSRTKAMEDLVGLVIQLPLAWLVGNLLRVEQRLVFYGKQRAKYLADELAAQAAGTDAAISGLDKLLLHTVCWRPVERAVRFDGVTDVWAEHRRAADALPAREHERLRRLEARRAARLEETHPAIRRRIAALQARPAQPPNISLEPEEGAALDRELGPLFRASSKAIKKELAVG
jgi:Zn-dependent protease with chaperone function